MIQASYQEGVLRVTGHALLDKRTCHAVSILLWTLHTHYGAPEPMDGEFEWDTVQGPHSIRRGNALNFVLNALSTLAEAYSDEVSFETDASRFSP